MNLVRQKWRAARSELGLLAQVAALAATPFDRARILWGGLAMKLRRGASVPVTAGYRVGGGSFRFTTTRFSDFRVLREVWCRREYAATLEGASRARHVVDLGANIGATLVWYRAECPRASLYGVEPDPVNFAQLERNAGEFAALSNGMVSGRSGTGRFYSEPGAGQSSSMIRRSDRAIETLVPMRTLDEQLDAWGLSEVDILKFDIEGAEAEVMGASRRLRCIGTLMGEFHEDLAGISLEDFTGLLEGFRVEASPIAPRRFLVLARRSA